MSAKVDQLAAEIAAPDETEQRVLFERAAEISFRHGLNQLSQHYRERLKQQGELDRAAEDILVKLREIREEIAAREYPVG